MKVLANRLHECTRIKWTGERTIQRKRMKQERMKEKKKTRSQLAIFHYNFLKWRSAWGKQKLLIIQANIFGITCKQNMVWNLQWNWLLACSAWHKAVKPTKSFEIHSQFDRNCFAWNISTQQIKCKQHTGLKWIQSLIETLLLFSVNSKDVLIKWNATSTA